MAGGVPVEFPTIAICDGITMAHKGMMYPLPSRELIADSIEAMTMAHGLDGLVLVVSCDKTIPGALMAAARMNIPAIVISGGPMPTGHYGTEVKGTLVHFGPLECDELIIEKGKYLADVFTRGGCLASFNEDDRPNVWKKVIINCTVNTVCALTRLKIFEVAQDKFGMELFRGVVTEACAIAMAKGVPFDADGFMNTHLKNFIDNMGDYYPSMAQDMLINHRQTEIDVLNAKISEYGRQFGLAPSNSPAALLSDFNT